MNRTIMMLYAASATAVVGLMRPATALASGATVEVSAVDSNYLAVAGGTALVPAGDLIQLGSFSIGDAQITALQSGNTITPGHVATLLAAFTPMNSKGSAYVGDGAMGYAGAFDVLFAGNNMAASQNPYLLAFNAPTAAAATEIGVFRGGADWTFPSDPNAGSTYFDLDTALTPPLIGTYTANTSVDIPWLIAYPVGFTAPNTFNLDWIAVPEPSSLALVVVGVLCGISLIGRRRS